MTNANNRNPEKARQRLAALSPFLKKRAKIIQAFRNEILKWDFLEVETPIRIRAPAPELYIDAEPSGDCFLITSPELQMKRLLAAGYSNIFQICHCFRSGEQGEKHLPEFTMAEWYRTGATTTDLMEDCEKLIARAAESVGVFPKVSRLGREVDFSPPWERVKVADAFERYAGWRPGADPDPDRFDRDLVLKVEPSLPADRPVFLEGYPASMASLAQLNEKDSTKADRFELYAGGLELANGFTELVDPVEQRRRFEKEATQRIKAKKREYPIDECFFQALELGLNPCAGIAMGLDRLVMLLTGAATIDQVVAFAEETLVTN
ncbi:MAG: EF-P lysine aminoacylase GenX [Proteobacteria bacterium]|nr:EF-P lysine aminoacylase GenX [Pseudomonadota bacterium]